VPRGTYLHLDGDGSPRAREHFSCAAGPSGWRYHAELRSGDDADVWGALDVVVDDAWRQVAVTLQCGEASVQGGLGGAEVVWVETGGPAAGEHTEAAVGFVGASPGLTVAVARLLGLAEGQGARLRLVRLLLPVPAGTPDSRPSPQSPTSRAPGVASPVVGPVDETWALTEVATYETDVRPLEVERYDVTDLASGETGVTYLAGDVVLDAPGLALDTLDSPPTARASSG
jgi:hypothetical protein